MNTAATLEQILRQPRSVQAVWHPLGFMDLQLSRRGNESVRIHIWSEVEGEYKRADVRIHKHDWRMRSLVLCGKVQNRVYSFCGGMPTHRVYSIVYDDRINVLRRTERLVSVAIAQTTVMGPNVPYSLPEGIFHDLEVSRNVPTATLVHAVRQPGFHNEVLGDIGGPEAYLTERVPCDTASICAAVKLVLESVATARRRGELAAG